MFDGDEQRHNYDDRLRNIEQVLIKLSTEIERDSKSRDEWRKHVTDILEQFNDVILRLDRLEQDKIRIEEDKKRTERVEGLAWTSVFGLLGKIIWDFISAHLK